MKTETPHLFAGRPAALGALTALAVGAWIAATPAFAVSTSSTASGLTDRQQLVQQHAYAHRRSTPPDSFLVYKVYSIDQLLDEVRSSPRIQKYYARHFHVPQSRILEYMQANLVESYIPETKTYTCYCVRHNGLIYPVKQRFTQGTKVFALKNGEPVLKWVCGNPLSKFLPAVETHTVEVPVVKVAPETDIISPTDNTEIVVPTETPFVTMNSSSDLDALVPHSIIGASNPNASSFVLVPTGGAGGFGLWPLAGLPVLFTVIHHGGSNGGGNNPSNIKPVPEASTAETSAILLAAGALFLGLRRRSAQRS